MAVNAIQSADNPAGDSGYYNDFLKENGLDPDKSEVLVSSNLGASANENDGASAESIQMIQSLFMTQSVDVFFSDYDFFYSLGEFDYFTDIRECFPEEVLEKYKDDIVYVKSTETGKKYPIGIKLKGNAWVEKTGWYPDTCVVGLAAGLKNKDLAVKFIEENILRINMSIVFDENLDLFCLETANTSYIIGLADHRTFVGHVYYGRRVRRQDLRYLLRTGEAPFVPSGNERECCSFYDTFPAEYSGNGVGDYRGKQYCRAYTGRSACGYADVCFL